MRVHVKEIDKVDHRKEQAFLNLKGRQNQDTDSRALSATTTNKGM